MFTLKGLGSPTPTSPLPRRHPSHVQRFLLICAARLGCRALLRSATDECYHCDRNHRGSEGHGLHIRGADSPPHRCCCVRFYVRLFCEDIQARRDAARRLEERQQLFLVGTHTPYREAGHLSRGYPRQPSAHRHRRLPGVARPASQHRSPSDRFRAHGCQQRVRVPWRPSPKSLDR